MKSEQKEILLWAAAGIFCVVAVFLSVYDAPAMLPVSGLTAVNEVEQTPSQESAIELEVSENASDEPTDTRMNLNTATLEQLQTLPGIGPTLAQRILDYREQYGGFSSVEDLDNVSGIGEKKLAAIRDLVTVG